MIRSYLVQGFEIFLRTTVLVYKQKDFLLHYADKVHLLISKEIMNWIISAVKKTYGLKIKWRAFWCVKTS